LHKGQDPVDHGDLIWKQVQSKFLVELTGAEECSAFGTISVKVVWSGRFESGQDLHVRIGTETVCPVCWGIHMCGQWYRIPWCIIQSSWMTGWSLFSVD